MKKYINLKIMALIAIVLTNQKAFSQDRMPMHNIQCEQQIIRFCEVELCSGSCRRVMGVDSYNLILHILDAQGNEIESKTISSSLSKADANNILLNSRVCN